MEAALANASALLLYSRTVKTVNAHSVLEVDSFVGERERERERKREREKEKKKKEKKKEKKYFYD